MNIKYILIIMNYLILVLEKSLKEIHKIKKKSTLPQQKKNFIIIIIESLN